MQVLDIATAAASVFVGVVIPIVAWSAIESLLFGSCDAKFGCLGGIWFAAAISSIAGLVAAVAAAVAILVMGYLRPTRPIEHIALKSLLAGGVLSYLLRHILRSSLSDFEMVGLWLAVSLLVCAATFLLFGRHRAA